jgi:hypothetical protein
MVSPSTMLPPAELLPSEYLATGADILGGFGGGIERFGEFV